MVGLQEVDGFLPFCEPEFVLGHCRLILNSGMRLPVGVGHYKAVIPGFLPS